LALRPSAPPRASKSTARPSNAPPKKVILVVEDDAKIRELIARALSGRYVVHQAADGLAAAELVDQMRAVDLIICDVAMPRADGLTFVRTLKRDRGFASVPVIFVSARGEPDDVVRGIAAGARHYLVKPFSLQELLDRVAKAIGRSSEPPK